MRFYKLITDGYIIAIGTGSNGDEITESEYNEIMSIIKTPREEPPTDYIWMLRADTLEYELVYSPAPTPEEPEAEISDYKSALTELGVDMND